MTLLTEQLGPNFFNLPVENQIGWLTSTIENAEHYIADAEEEIKDRVRDIAREHKKGNLKEVRYHNTRMAQQFERIDKYTAEITEAKEILTRVERKAAGWGPLDEYLDEVYEEDVKWQARLVEAYRTATKEERKGWTKSSIAFARMSAAAAAGIFKYDLQCRRIKFSGQIEEKVGDLVSFDIERNPNGGFDGYVVGTKGEASITTIGAGGYNIQRFHYRTTVRAAK